MIHFKTKVTKFLKTTVWLHIATILSKLSKAINNWNYISSKETLLLKSLQAINAGDGVEKREPSYTVGGNAN